MANTIGTAYIQIEPSTEGIGNAISDALNKDASSAGKSAGSALSSALGTAAKVGTAAIAATTAAVIGLGKSSVEAGAQFDSAMSQVAATMGYSLEEMNKEGSEAQETFNTLREFAQEMGSSTAFSASEAAEALNYMALAGYDAGTSMDMLPTVLNLAAAGGLDLASASDMVTDAQSALGLSLDDTATMVDQMATASSKSNTSVGQLGEAFLTIGANAKSLSGGTQELSTALGILADNGIKGAEGGTHLRNILLAMNPTTKAAKEAWDELGVSAYDADGNLRPLQDTFADLNSAMDGMTDQEKSDIISKMFNKTDLASVNALLSTSSERWNELSSAIGESAGSAEAMAQVQLDNLNGDITLFQSALEGAKIAISDELTPTLREFVQFGSNGLSSLTEAFKKNGLSGAMEELGNILTNLVSMVTKMAPQLVKAGASLLASLVSGIAQNLPMIAQTAIDIVLDLAEGIGNALPNMVPAAIEIITQLITTILSADNITRLIDCALKLIVGLAQGLIAALPELIKALPQIISGIINGLLDGIPLIIQAGIDLLLSLIDALPDIIDSIVEALPQIITGIVNGLLGNIDKIIVAGVKLFIALIENLPTIIIAIVKAVPEIISAIVKGFADAWPQIKEAGQELLLNLKEGISEKISDLKEKISDIKDSVLDWFKEIPKNIVNIGKNIIEGLWNGINDKVSWIKNKITSFSEQVLDSIKGFFGIHSPSKVMADEVGKYLPEGIAVGVDANADSLYDSMDEMTTKAVTVAQVSSRNLASADIKTTESTESFEDVMYRAFSKALNDHKISFNDRELGRLVKSYA